MTGQDRSRSGGRPSLAGRRLPLAAGWFGTAALLAMLLASASCGAPLPSQPAGTAASPATSAPRPAVASSPPPAASLAPSRAPASPAAGDPLLVVLDVVAGRTSIDAHPLGGPPYAVPPPTGALQWLAADTMGRLVATRIDGGIVAATDPSLDDPGWAELGIVTPRRSPPLSFGAPDPGGDQIAALAAAYGTGEPSGLVVVRRVSPTMARSRLIDTGLEANGAAPAWLGGDIVVAGLGSDGAPGTVIVDPASGTVRPGPGKARAVASSGDGRRVAVVGADQRTVAVEETPDWLSSEARAVSPGLVPSEPVGVVAGLALDATGRSLAIVWSGPDLRPAVVVRYEDVAGWRERERIALRPGTVRAAVAWVRASADPGR